MSDNRNDALTSFLLGAAIGAGVALLLSPEAGTEVRRRLGDAANRLGGNLGDKLGTVGDKLSTVKDDLKHRASDVKSAIGAGRDAYARARTGDEPVPTSNAM
jgi:gas vesicle protein